MGRKLPATPKVKRRTGGGRRTRAVVAERRPLTSVAAGETRFAEIVAVHQPEDHQRRHTRRNLFRMRQFYEAYRGNEKVSPLVTQLPWTQHLIILSQAKPVEAREFYVVAAIRGSRSHRPSRSESPLAACFSMRSRFARRTTA